MKTYIPFSDYGLEVPEGYEFWRVWGTLKGPVVIMTHSENESVDVPIPRALDKIGRVVGVEMRDVMQEGWPGVFTPHPEPHFIVEEKE